ncbi:hypothetical protein ACJ41O_001512 [Fusarium nematophilum]
MYDTFHLFNYLPWELRNQIWNFAVRPGYRGAHVFRLYNPQNHEHPDGNINMLIPPSSYPELRDCRLAAPGGAKSWKDNNLSAYLIDGGLWAACKESRLVMERRFQCQKWRPLPRDDQERRDRQRMPREKTRDMPATGYFTGDDGVAHYFTVCPHRDLFILQPQDMNTINWGRPNLDIQIGSSWWGFHCLQNIAFEYNPEWGTQWADAFPPRRERDVIRQFVRMAIHLAGAPNIWIIDYNLTLTDDAVISENMQNTPQKGRSMAFYASGRRFVEAETTYLACGRGQCRYVEKVECGPRNLTSVLFVQEVKNEAAWIYRHSLERDEPSPCHVGLLAWDRRRV